MSEELDLLNTIYSNTKMGSSTLNAILPEISDNNLRQVILTQINEYDTINNIAQKEIFNLGEEPKAPVFSTKMAAWESKFNSSINNSNTHIAEMIMKGSNMGLIDIIKKMNTRKCCDPKSYGLGRKLIQTEENNIDRIKAFL